MKKCNLTKPNIVYVDMGLFAQEKGYRCVIKNLLTATQYMVEKHTPILFPNTHCNTRRGNDDELNGHLQFRCRVTKNAKDTSI